MTQIASALLLNMGTLNARTIDSQLARRVMEEYFMRLSEEDYPSAYELLSDADKRNITLPSFTEPFETKLHSNTSCTACSLLQERTFYEYTDFTLICQAILLCPGR